MTATEVVVNSQHNFDLVAGQSAEIITSYFDFEDDEVVKLDLWIAAEAGLHAADLILQVQKDFGGFLPSSDAANLPQLMADNDAVLAELRSTSGIWLSSDASLFAEVRYRSRSSAASLSRFSLAAACGGSHRAIASRRSTCRKWNPNFPCNVRNRSRAFTASGEHTGLA